MPAETKQTEAATPDVSHQGALTTDLIAGVVVFLVALPLCLGIALASGAPPLAGLLGGIIGGLVVGSLSGSHTNVSGPAAGLTAVVAAQIMALGSFEAFLFAVFLAGLIQIAMGVLRAGAIAAFVPSSVIKGLLAAIGVILILKQIPHLCGHDTDFEGEMSFEQPDKKNTFTELATLFQGEIHEGAMIVGLLSIALLVFWDRCTPLKKSFFPAPLAVVLLGVAFTFFFRSVGGAWLIGPSHLVDVPGDGSVKTFLSSLTMADFSAWNNSEVYMAAITIAIVASLETLLNAEAVDKLDPQQRKTPPSRELIAQGVGNTIAGLIGALPITAVIVRGSVNVAQGAKTKVSAIFHGVLLLLAVVLFPVYLNTIPLAALAAILLVTGVKLASPRLFKQMWNEGRYQFVPFIVTLLAIVFTDLLKGILIGLATGIVFILNSNLRRPVRRIVETHLGGEVLHIELANQVSFLNKATLSAIFDEVPAGSKVLIDARDTDFIDPDAMSLIREFRETKGPAHGVTVSLRGFRDKYEIHNEVMFADYSTRELRDQVTPQQVLEWLKVGHRRFRDGQQLSRDFQRQIKGTAGSQTPMAVILSCIDSRVPVEVVFDLGIGDVFTARVAGNVLSDKTLGSLEYGVIVAGAKLVLVLGHTRCGAVTSAIQLTCSGKDAAVETGCAHLPVIVDEIAANLKSDERLPEGAAEEETEAFIDEIAQRNVLRTVEEISHQSEAIRKGVDDGSVLVVGAMYDVKSGDMTFLSEGASARS